MSAYRIRRPTEDAAVTRAERRPVRLPSTETLFDRLVVARRIGDRHGAQLFGLAIVRKAQIGGAP